MVYLEFHVPGRFAIEDAERKVEKAIGKICDQCKNENGCVPCRFRKRLLNNLATTIVSCERGEKCGRTDEANTKITIISPNGFNPNSYCGCLEATLLHELFHIIGVDEQYHRYINDIEVACFSCGKLLGPDYDETYGNIHDIP